MQRRSGFTIVELAVAMGILVVLMGLMVVAFKVVGNSGKHNDTKTVLETAKAMLSEVEATGGFQRLKNLYTDPNDGTSYFFEPVPAPQGSIENDPNRPRQVVWTMAPPSVPSATSGAIYTYLLNSQNNKKALEKLPKERMANLPQNLAQTTPAPILIDGWGHPVLFVPPGGLVVTLKDVGQRVVTSAAVVAVGTPTPPGARPFFVSAGPDGDYSTGDDNVYSFEN